MSPTVNFLLVKNKKYLLQNYHSAQPLNNFGEND